MADKNNTVVHDGLTPLDEALATKIIGEKAEGPSKSFDCPSCENESTVVKDPSNVYENKELGLKLIIPAHVCSNCGYSIYEPNDYKNLLQAEEIASGRPYVRVVVKNGRVSKYSVH